MKTAYFDTIAGISGDMTLGAFLSAGVSLEDLRSEIGKLGLKGIELEASHIMRNGITAVKLDVVVSASGGHHRHLQDILRIIEGSSLTVRVKENAVKIFNEVAKAESKIHDTPIEKIHFHEVGALDSIVDIVGAAICIDLLGIERVYSSPVKLGCGGFVDAEHGKLPVPSPAAVEILRGYPSVLTQIPFELTTPTGAAIIKALSSGILSSETISVESIGYGAGTRDIPNIPNLLRVMIGELKPEYTEEEMMVVETNIDDMNPEIFPFVIEKLFEKGANDAYLTPVMMKKGRPGMLLSATVSRGKLDNLVAEIFSQTTTLGVRIHVTERKKLARHECEVKTSFGTVRAKLIEYNGLEHLVPEFEECKRLAIRDKMPLVEVYRILEKELAGRGG